MAGAPLAAAIIPAAIGAAGSVGSAVLASKMAKQPKAAEQKTAMPAPQIGGIASTAPGSQPLTFQRQQVMQPRQSMAMGLLNKGV